MQKMGGPILMIYTLHDIVLLKELPFGGHDDCTCIKIFSGINFLIVINSP